MECPPHAQKALEHIRLNINTPADEKLVATWLDWYVRQQQEIDDTEKWQSPAKRLRSSAGE